MKPSVLRVADYLIRRLADVGVRDIFLLPGGGAMYLNDAIACEKRINPVPCHHEQACGIAAEAYGRTHPVGFGVAIVTAGPGGTNIVTPVAGAWIESLPLMIISGQVKRLDAINGRAIRQGGVQEVDIVSVVKPITKYAVTIESPATARKCLEEALWHMKSGRPGPVWLDVPLDVQAAPIDPCGLEGFISPESVLTENLQATIGQLNAILERAERPVFVIGHGVRIAGGTEAFRQLAEQLGIPCVFTWNASDTFEWEHDLYIGCPGVVAARAPNFAVQNSDCMVSIGCRLDNVITAYDPAGFARAARKIVVDVDQNELDRHQMPIDVKICANARDFIGEWSTRLPKIGDIRPWKQKCLDWKHRYRPLDGKTFSRTSPIGHFQLVDKLSDIIGEDQLVVTGSSGLAVEVFYTAFRSKKGQRIFLTSGLGAMGYGLPAAIGACMGAGGQPTVCVESDGSLMLNLQELVTLKQMNLPITLVIMNNNGYASIRNTQRNYFSSRYIGSNRESGLLIPDFMALASAVGIDYVRITDIVELQASLFFSGLRIVEVILEGNEVLAPKVSALPQPDGSIISMPLEDMSPLLPRDVLRKEMLIPLHPVSEKVND
ncbi:MAG: Acetolactate synthase large subunit [Nitrosomonadaceae bacterium]|nr:Acetolactate synthase large subunit [Nitrosomonadaceae bacterium]